MKRILLGLLVAFAFTVNAMADKPVAIFSVHTIWIIENPESAVEITYPDDLKIVSVIPLNSRCLSVTVEIEGALGKYRTVQIPVFHHRKVMWFPVPRSEVLKKAKEIEGRKNHH